MMVYKQLLEGPIKSEHVSKILIELLQTNTAYTSSRSTNMFSKLSGAYLLRHKQKKFKYESVAVFPIYATLRDPSNDISERSISGFVITGPHHAKSSTDKINIITIELIKNDSITNEFFQHIHNSFIYKSIDFTVIIRNNAVNKNDLMYLTYMYNSLFVPINFVRDATINNPNNVTNCNKNELIQSTSRDNSR